MSVLSQMMGPEWFTRLTWPQVAAMGIWSFVFIALIVLILWALGGFTR